MRFLSFWFLQLTSFHRIVPGMLQAQNKHHIDVFNPPPRPVGSPFPRNHRTTLVATPPASKTRPHCSTTPSISPVVSTAACPLEDSARTFFKVSVFVFGSPPAVESPNFPHLTHHNNHRLLHCVQGSGNDFTRLGSSTCCIADRSHTRRCHIAATVSLHTPLSNLSRRRLIS